MKFFTAINLVVRYKEYRFLLQQEIRNAKTGGSLLHDKHWLEVTSLLFITHQEALWMAASWRSWPQSMWFQPVRKRSLKHKTQNFLLSELRICADYRESVRLNINTVFYLNFDKWQKHILEVFIALMSFLEIQKGRKAYW